MFHVKIYFPIKYVLNKCPTKLIEVSRIILYKSIRINLFDTKSM